MGNSDKKGFRLFNKFQRDSRGLSKTKADNGFGLKRFFVTFKDNFNKIMLCNIFMVLGNFPVVFIIAALSGYTQADAYLPMHDIYQNLSAHFSVEAPSSSSMVFYALEGLQNQILVPTTTTYVFYGIGALTLFTFGLVNVGTAYILRNIAMGEPTFVWSDFWYAVKRNWKQALPFGIIDIAINALLLLNIYSMYVEISTSPTSNLFTSTLFWSNIVIFILYFVMRFYIYIQMVTFKLSVLKIIKNSLIFAALGIKRNALALLAIVLVIITEFSLLFGFGGILVSIAVALPLLILFSGLAYMKVYAAYYKIKEIMIDPYKEEHPEPEAEEEEIIMVDDVTEIERLEEIKRRNGIE